MFIAELTIQNVLRAKFVEIITGGETVILEGKNGAGKSTVLDSIEMVFGGKKVIPKQPINTNAEDGSKSQIIAKLSPDDDNQIFTITRYWSKGGETYIKIENEQGLVPASIKGWLSALFGDISFDPIKFMGFKAEQQVEILLKAMNVDLTDLTNAYQSTYKLRTDVNTNVNTLKGQLEAYKEVGPVVEVESVDEVLENRKKLADNNQAITDAQEEINLKNGTIGTHNSSIVSIRDNMAILQKEIEDKKALIAGNEKAIKNHEEAVKVLGEEITVIMPVSEKKPENLTVIDDRIKLLNQLAEKNTKAEAKVILLKQYKEAEDLAASYTLKLKGFKDEKKDRITNANFPIKGLNVEAGEVYYNKLPFDQASQAEQIKVTMGIAMATRPNLKVILIRTASLLDTESLDSIKTICKKHGYQLWLERVADKASNTDNAFFIEDGGVISG